MLKRLDSLRFAVLIVALLLTALTSLWCAIHYVAAEPQLIETRAELQRAQTSGLSDTTVEVHVARARRWKNHWGIATLLAAGATLMIMISMAVGIGRGDQHI